jgi:hypothetical protein
VIRLGGFDEGCLRLEYDKKREIKGQTQKMHRTPLIIPSLSEVEVSEFGVVRTKTK